MRSMRVTLFRRGLFFWVYYRLNGSRIRRPLGTENRKIAETCASTLKRRSRAASPCTSQGRPRSPPSERSTRTT